MNQKSYKTKLITNFKLINQIYVYLLLSFFISSMSTQRIKNSYPSFQNQKLHRVLYVLPLNCNLGENFVFLCCHNIYRQTQLRYYHARVHTATAVHVKQYGSKIHSQQVDKLKSLLSNSCTHPVILCTHVSIANNIYHLFIRN